MHARKVIHVLNMSWVSTERLLSEVIIVSNICTLTYRGRPTIRVLVGGDSGLAHGGRGRGVGVSCALGLDWKVTHAKNNIADVLKYPVFSARFLGQNTVICAGAMPYRPEFPALTRIYAFQAYKFCVQCSS